MDQNRILIVPGKRHTLRAFVLCFSSFVVGGGVLWAPKPFGSESACNAHRVYQRHSTLPAPPLPSRIAGAAGRATTRVRPFSALPLFFEPNRGQAGATTKFLARGRGYLLNLTETGARLSLHPSRATARSANSRERMTDLAAARHASPGLQMRFLGADPVPHVAGIGELPGRSNYFIGNDPRRWHTNIPTYAKVRYQNVYPGVDLVFHGRQGLLEYDFAVKPGSRPAQILLGFRGAEGLSIDPAGNLVVGLGQSAVLLRKPRAFQQDHGQEHEVSASFDLKGAGKVAFTLGPYDHSRALMIDPVLSYSTYLGGSGSDQADGLAVDGSGHVFVTGRTLSTDFPTTAGAVQASLKGSTDVFVAEFDPTGSTLLYSTYLGGSGNDISSHIAVDASGDVYVTGLTSSADFPIAGAFQTALKGSSDAFVTKLNATGTALVYSSYLGGSGQDYANSLAVDSSGSAYVVGVTFSSDFPATAGAFQTSYGGNSAADAFVAKLKSDGSGLVYATYLGGAAGDEGNAIAVDASGAAYVAGDTSSANFPTANPLQAALAGGKDAFVAKLAPDGSALTYSTYLGGTGDDVAIDIAVDSAGNAYVAGQTNSSNFPLAAAYQTNPGGGLDAFVAKINAAGSSLVYSTYLGGSNDDFARALALDSSGHVYVTGQTSSLNFPALDSLQTTLFSSDAFVTELDPTGASLVFSTYLGGSGQETGTGIAADSSGNVYVAGDTTSTDFPTLSGGLQAASGGGTDAFVVKISPTDSPAVSLNHTALTFTDQSVGTNSQAKTVILRNVGSASLSISGITVSGDFAQTNTCFSSVPGGSSCSISITFSPSARGARTGTLSVADNAAASPQTVSLSGNGIVTAVTLSANSLTFSSQNIGTTSAAQTVTLTNTGADALTLSGFIVTGDFAQTNNCGSSVAAGGSCTLSVTFSPTQALSRTGSLEAVDNAPGSPQGVALSGTGVGPSVTLSSSSLTFGEQPVGTTSGPQTVSLTNSGNATLTIASKAITGNFTETDDCTATLDAGKSCTFGVTFKPATAGTTFGAITINDNAPGTPHQIKLSGNAIAGSAPEAFLSSPAVSFGAEPVTTSSAPQTLKLTNTGNASLSVKGIAVTGDYSQTNDCGASVAAGASCNITLTFAPMGAGTRSGSVAVTDNATGSPHTSMLTGVGTDFALSAATPIAAVSAGQSASYTLTVTPVAGFNQQVSLACSGAPQGAACTLDAAQVTLDGANPATVKVTVSTAARSWTAPPPAGPPAFSRLAEPARLGGLLALLALALLSAEVLRRLRVPRTWLLLGLLLPLLFWSACNVGSRISGTPAGNFTLTVTGTTTATSGMLTHSAKLGLTVN